MLIYMRRAKESDIGDMLIIAKEARELLKEDGSPQWADGGPTREKIAEDVRNEEAYLLIVNGETAAMMTVQLRPEKNYACIEGGSWKESGDYAVLHRLGIKKKFRGMGLSKYLFSNVLSMCYIKGYKNVRADTYKLNFRMQKIFYNLGFKYRGKIYTDDKIDPERMAYELNLE